jgi:hypothetical protein
VIDRQLSRLMPISIYRRPKQRRVKGSVHMKKEIFSIYLTKEGKKLIESGNIPKQLTNVKVVTKSVIK